MDTFRSFRDWFRWHKRKIFISAAVVSAGYVCYKAITAYHARLQAESEEREVCAALLHQAAQRTEAHLQDHFQTVQKISDATVLPSVLPYLERRLSDQLDTFSLTERLRSQSLALEEKLELWQEIKRLSFVYIMCSIWGLILLILLIRVQVNVIGRHVYLDTARDHSSPETVDLRKALTMRGQRKFMAFYEYLPHRGLEMLISDMKSAVHRSVGSKSLQEPITIAKLENIFDEIFRAFKSGEVSCLHYLLPSDNILSPNEFAAFLIADPGEYPFTSDDEDHKVGHLLDEIRGILNSKEFKEVLCLSFYKVLNRAMEICSGMFQERSTESLPLIRLLSLLSRAGSMLFEQGIVEMITSQPQVQSFCMMVYTAGGLHSFGV